MRMDNETHGRFLYYDTLNPVVSILRIVNIYVRDRNSTNEQRKTKTEKNECPLCVCTTAPVVAYNLNKSHLNTYDVLILSELVVWLPLLLLNLVEVEQTVDRKQEQRSSRAMERENS